MTDHADSTYSQGLNMPVLCVVAAVGAILTYVSVIGVQAYYDAGLRWEEQVKLIEPTYEPLEKLNKQQETALNQVHWVDEKAGIAAVPIEQGMAKVIAEYTKASQ